MKTQHSSFVIGVDFGTLSGRAVVVRVDDGTELGSATHHYEHGVMATALPGGAALGADWALQMPSDYVSVLRNAVPEALDRAGVDPARVVAIGTDFTACTMVPTTADGTPLNELPELAGDPHSYAKLWKHHAAQAQADRINALAAKRAEAWLPRYGGLISAEWEFAKALQVLEESPTVYAAMEHWVEASDWIVWQLCGDYVRNACAAGYKGIYQDGTYPTREFLAELNVGFADFVTTKLEHRIGALGAPAGRLTAEAAAWTGLPEGIVVAVGNVDAHVTAPAARATEPGQMLAIMGTSTCHIMNGEVLREVPGMCGVVDGGIVPGLWGYEAGQSGVGDIFGWFVDSAVPPGYHDEAEGRGMSVHDVLTEKAMKQEVGQHGLVALDWHSGNRSVLVDHELSGVILGLTLATKPEDTYRALVESTAFGTRMIVETFASAGVPVTEFIAAGGLVKNRFLMQVYADVLDLPISTVTSDQAPALGSAIHAAVAAGCYPDVHAASSAMGGVDRDTFVPIADNVKAYDVLYAEYRRLHDHFGRQEGAMRRLKALRREILSRRSA